LIKKVKNKNLSLVKTGYNKYLLAFFIFSFLSIFKGNNLNAGFETLLSPIFSYIAFFLISLEIIDLNLIKKYYIYLFIGGLIFINYGLYYDLYRQINYFYRNNQLASTSGFLILIFYVNGF